jgi:hypothetical protein
MSAAVDEVVGLSVSIASAFVMTTLSKTLFGSCKRVRFSACSRSPAMSAAYRLAVPQGCSVELFGTVDVALQAHIGLALVGLSSGVGESRHGLSSFCFVVVDLEFSSGGRDSNNLGGLAGKADLLTEALYI